MMWLKMVRPQQRPLKGNLLMNLFFGFTWALPPLPGLGRHWGRPKDDLPSSPFLR